MATVRKRAKASSTMASTNVAASMAMAPAGEMSATAVPPSTPPKVMPTAGVMAMSP